MKTFLMAPVAAAFCASAAMAVPSGPANPMTLEYYVSGIFTVTVGNGEAQQLAGKIVGVGNTASATGFAEEFGTTVVPLSSLQFIVEDGPTYTYQGSYHLYANREYGAIGFSSEGPDSNAVIDVNPDGGLLLTGIEPGAIPGYLYGYAMPTDLGTLRIQAGDEPYNMPWFNIRVAEVEESSPAPEAATWAMMVAGFGLTGAAMRRRRVSVRFA